MNDLCKPGDPHHEPRRSTLCQQNEDHDFHGKATLFSDYLLSRMGITV
jgi:hypothetical protein